MCAIKFALVQSSLCKQWYSYGLSIHSQGQNRTGWGCLCMLSLQLRPKQVVITFSRRATLEHASLAALLLGSSQ